MEARRRRNSTLTFRVAAAICMTVVAIATVSASEVPEASASASCLNPGKRLPVLPVHGLEGDPSDFTAHGPDPLIADLDQLRNVAVDDTFSYASVADRWVTNSGIGQALPTTSAVWLPNPSRRVAPARW